MIQFTPLGSGSSIQFGVNLTTASPGSAQGLLLAVSDIEDARRQLVTRGVDASEVFHCETGTACRFPGIEVRVGGPAAERASYSSSLSFADPDGNGWLLQEVTGRLPGRSAMLAQRLSPDVIQKVLSESSVAGSPTNIQFMVKDSKKYASTGGWGFAQFTDGKPDAEAVHKTCFPCHAPAKDGDFVFTHYSH